MPDLVVARTPKLKIKRVLIADSQMRTLIISNTTDANACREKCFRSK